MMTEEEKKLRKYSEKIKFEYKLLGIDIISTNWNINIFNKKLINLDVVFEIPWHDHHKILLAKTIMDLVTRIHIDIDINKFISMTAYFVKDILFNELGIKEQIKNE